MDFFERQDEARRQIRRLYLLYGLAFVAVSLVTALGFVCLVGLILPPAHAPRSFPLWRGELFFYISVLTAALILMGTHWRLYDLRVEGGRGVANLLGGRWVSPATREPREHRLIRIVEEMALASGWPVPSVYVLHREYRADAAAVQFTRHGTAVASALKTIGGLGDGSTLVAYNAEECSHLFYANAIDLPWLRWLATHPPLETRIRAIEPSFDGNLSRNPESNLG